MEIVWQRLNSQKLWKGSQKTQYFDFDWDFSSNKSMRIFLKLKILLTSSVSADGDAKQT
jgi:hypothetical protein